MKIAPLNVFSDKAFLILLLIAVFGATLRIYALAERSLWLDEALSAQFASQSISEIVANTTDPHPPLYYMLLHTWVTFFGTSEQSLRSLSVVFSTVAIVLIGLLGFLLYDRRTGLSAALLMAAMVFPLHYAREARGYSVFLVMTLGSFYLCLKSLRGGGKRNWLGYLLFTVGLSYTHHYWVFLVLAQNLYVLLFYRTEKPVLIRWTGIQIGVVLCFLPWLIPLLKQTGRVMQEGFWISQPGISDLMNTLWRYFTLLDYRPILWGYIILCALGIAQLRAVSGSWRWKALKQSLESYRWEMCLDNVQRSSFLLLWFICSVLVPFLLSQLFTPFFLHRYTIGAIPALYLLLARGIWQVPTIFLRGLVITAIALVSLASLQHYHAPTALGRAWDYEPWREWVAYLTQRVEPADVIVIFPPYSVVPFDYYAKDSLPYYVLPAVINEENRTSALLALNPSTREWIDLETLTRGKRRVWLVFRKSPSQRGRSTVEFFRDRYQEIAIKPAINSRSNLTVLLFDLT